MGDGCMCCAGIKLTAAGMDVWKGIIILLLVCGNITCYTDDQNPHSNLSLNISLYVLADLCSDLPDGAYPDYTQACRMFFVCSQGKKAATFWCTKGFVFSLTSGHCEPPDRALCPDRKNPSVLDEVVSLRTGLRIDECDLPDGVYPEFRDGCASFYMCKDGLKTAFQCPGTSIYDWRTKTCRESNGLLCSKLSCEGREDGVYIDSNSYCKRYFHCTTGNITEHVCPEGYIYNARYDRCTRSATTRCQGIETVQCNGIPDGYYPDFSTNCKVFGLCMGGSLKTFNCPAKTAFDSKTMTCENDAVCPKLDISKCVGKSNGIHPDYSTGCRDFYLCLDGLLTHQGSCPLGKVINPVSGNCQPSSLVVCSPVVDRDCDGLPDGVYPDYDTGCSAYFVCVSNRRVSTSYCTDNDLFDIATGKCLPSSFVLCRDHSSFVSAPRLFDSYNCDNRLGVYPEFSSDCRRFVACVYGQMKFHECPEGSAFDPESDSCRLNSKTCKAPFAIATFQCLPGDDGVYIGNNCTEWHECRNGIGFTNICPRGMQYDLRLGKCALNVQSCSPGYIIQKRMYHLMNMVPTEVLDTSYKCPSDLIGVYPDPNMCGGRFHICVDGRKSSYACPSNYTYDAITQSCVVSDKPSRCDSDDSRRLESVQNTFSCGHLEDGMYPDYKSDCRRYFVCENGKGIPVYCPERQMFNPVKMMCEREDHVRCSAPRHYVPDSVTRKRNRQSDDVYHVYKPDDLYTETYGYDTLSRNNPVTKAPDPKSRVWDEYDIYPSENAPPSSTDLGYDSNISKVPNTIQNDSTTSKRQYGTKHVSDPVSTKAPVTTVVSEDQNHQARNQTTVKIVRVRGHNSMFDAACRKGDTGFFPDYESGCKMFHICFRTIRKTYSCPSILLFNPETKNCDLPENVFCFRPEPVLETDFDCRENINKFVPDYDSNCRNYFGCINDLPHRFSCSKGKIFNPNSSQCEAESSFTCDPPKSSSDESADDNLPSYRHVHGIPGRFFFSCSDKPDGFYPDFIRHCHVFYRCVKGKKFSHYCKQGLLFNPESGICDFEENVTCSPDNGTTTGQT